MLLKGRRRGDSWIPCIKKISKYTKKVFKVEVAPVLQWVQGLIWHTMNRHKLNLSTFQGGQSLVVNIMPSLNGKALPVTKYINLGLVLCWRSHMEFGQTGTQTEWGCVCWWCTGRWTLCSSIKANKRSSCTMSLRKICKTPIPNFTIKLNGQARPPCKKGYMGCTFGQASKWPKLRFSQSASSTNSANSLIHTYKNVSLLGTSRALHRKGEITSAGSSAVIPDDSWKCSSCTECQGLETSTGSLLILFTFVWTPTCFGALCRTIKEPLTYWHYTQSCWLYNCITTLHFGELIFFQLCHSGLCCQTCELVVLHFFLTLCVLVMGEPVTSPRTRTRTFVKYQEVAWFPSLDFICLPV